jgi:hypothetical protein
MDDGRMWWVDGNIMLLPNVNLLVIMVVLCERTVAVDIRSDSMHQFESYHAQLSRRVHLSLSEYPMTVRQDCNVRKMFHTNHLEQL